MKFRLFIEIDPCKPREEPTIYLVERTESGYRLTKGNDPTCSYDVIQNGGTVFCDCPNSKHQRRKPCKHCIGLAKYGLIETDVYEDSRI